MRGRRKCAALTPWHSMFTCPGSKLNCLAHIYVCACCCWRYRHSIFKCCVWLETQLLCVAVAVCRQPSAGAGGTRAGKDERGGALRTPLIAWGALCARKEGSIVFAMYTYTFVALLYNVHMNIDISHLSSLASSLTLPLPSTIQVAQHPSVPS